MLFRLCSTKSKGPHTRPGSPLRGVEKQKPREPGQRFQPGYIVSIHSGGHAPAPPAPGKSDDLASATRLRLRPDLLGNVLPPRVRPCPIARRKPAQSCANSLTR